MNEFPLDAHWVWLILGVTLATVEILLPGFFLIWIGLAAVATGLLTLAFGLGDAAQFASFALLAVGSVVAGRRWFAQHPIASTDPLLNLRGGRLVGETVTVVEPIEGGQGRVRVADGVWSAKGADAAIGDRMRVTGLDGNCLIVEPLRALPPSQPENAA